MSLTKPARLHVACGMILAAVLARPVSAAPADQEVITVMNQSAAAWNSGDLGRFMAASYENDPATVLVTSRGLVTGYAAIAGLYRDHFGHRKGGPGTLSFDHLLVRGLTPAYAIVYGNFRLVPAAGGAAETGVFDLLFHKSAAGWRIISDHTA